MSDSRKNHLLKKLQEKQAEKKEQSRVFSEEIINCLYQQLINLNPKLKQKENAQDKHRDLQRIFDGAFGEINKYIEKNKLTPISSANSTVNLYLGTDDIFKIIFPYISAINSKLKEFLQKPQKVAIEQYSIDLVCKLLQFFLKHIDENQEALVNHCHKELQLKIISYSCQSLKNYMQIFDVCYVMTNGKIADVERIANIITWIKKLINVQIAIKEKNDEKIIGIEKLITTSQDQNIIQHAAQALKNIKAENVNMGCAINKNLTFLKKEIELTKTLPALAIVEEKINSHLLEGIFYKKFDIEELSMNCLFEARAIIEENSDCALPSSSIELMIQLIQSMAAKSYFLEATYAAQETFELLDDNIEQSLGEFKSIDELLSAIHNNKPVTAAHQNAIRYYTYKTALNKLMAGIYPGAQRILSVLIPNQKHFELISNPENVLTLFIKLNNAANKPILEKLLTDEGLEPKWDAEHSTFLLPDFVNVRFITLDTALSAFHAICEKNLGLSEENDEEKKEISPSITKEQQALTSEINSSKQEIDETKQETIPEAKQEVDVKSDNKKQNADITDAINKPQVLIKWDKDHIFDGTAAASAHRLFTNTHHLFVSIHPKLREFLLLNNKIALNHLKNMCIRGLVLGNSKGKKGFILSTDQSSLDKNLNFFTQNNNNKNNNAAIVKNKNKKKKKKNKKNQETSAASESKPMQIVYGKLKLSSENFRFFAKPYKVDEAGNTLIEVAAYKPTHKSEIIYFEYDDNNSLDDNNNNNSKTI